MTTQNTTTEKQAKLIEFAKSLGVTLEKLQEMYKDPIKASVLNVIAEGL
jgi:hypothetical protein